MGGSFHGGSRATEKWLATTLFSDLLFDKPRVGSSTIIQRSYPGFVSFGPQSPSLPEVFT